ncbi:MAG: head GIN domain-containing protein [Chitinophagales bacterium]
MNPVFKFSILVTLMMIFHLSTQAQQQAVLSFDAIHASGNVEVLLQEGGGESVNIEAEGVDEDRVITEVKGGVLKVRIQNVIYNENKSARVVVTYRDLREIKAHAGARIYSRTAVKGDKLELKAGSGANIDLEVWMDVVEGRVSEGGEIELTGETHTLNAIASTGGLFYGYGLEAEEVYARSNTGGEMEVNAHKRIEAKASIGGNVSYKGNPKHKSVSTNLGGTICGR